MKNLTKSRERVKKYGEVYTPEWVVKKMCDALPEDAWYSIDRTFLEPSCGNGNFLVEILRRKLELCCTPDDGLEALKSITAIDILPDNCEESRKRLLDMYHEKFSKADIEYLIDARSILNEKIICGNSLEIMKKWAEEETKCSSPSEASTDSSRSSSLASVAASSMRMCMRWASVEQVRVQKVN